MLTCTQAERFINKLGAERYSERIRVVEKYKEQWELSEITFQQSLSINSLISMRFQNGMAKSYSKFLLTMSLMKI